MIDKLMLNKSSYEIMGLVQAKDIAPGMTIAWSPREITISDKIHMGLGGWPEVHGLSGINRSNDCELFPTTFGTEENAIIAAKHLGIVGSASEMATWYQWFMARPFTIGRVASIGVWNVSKKVELFVVRFLQKAWKIARSDDFVFVLAQKPKEKKVKNSEDPDRTPLI